MIKIAQDRLYLIGKIILWCFLIVLTVNLALMISEGLTIRSLPFVLKNGEIMKYRDDSYRDLLSGKIVTAIDTLETFSSEPDETRDVESSGINLTFDEDIETISILADIYYAQIIQGREYIEITYEDTLTDLATSCQVKTINVLDLIKFLEILTYIFFLIFSLTNSYILIRYSSSRDNLLVVLFLLLLFTPKASILLNSRMLGIWTELLSPFWGIVFYHFILLKTGVEKNISKLYIINFVVIFGLYFLQFLGIRMNIPNFWAVFWLIKGFLLLRKQYKIKKDIGLKRLLAAFGGLGFSLFSVLLLIVFVLLLLLFAGIGSLAGLSGLLENMEVLAVAFGIIALLPIIGFIIGILWFFGSFSWSLLTGTVMDVKIRSTLIYTLVGFTFIVIFGLIDYSLGEILQSVFGKFFGSEFIAGIPATIGLLLFFNPVRNYAEKLVDKKLNTTELDFLEKAESFTRDISEEGIIEGFEEYICDNLIKQLPISKIAIVSFDKELNNYKFNEIRGSDIIENSAVKDRKRILEKQELFRNYSSDDDEQDIASFALIIPILIEEEHKWFLAFGGKTDNSSYNKKDLDVLQGLVEKIRLSLKFILTYEILTREKFLQIISLKDDQIAQKEKEIVRLRKLTKIDNDDPEPEEDMSK